MALTQISTAGISNDAVTGNKIATNSVGEGELSTNAVTTAKIANDAVTADKLANTAVTAGTYGSSTSIPAITIDQQGRITTASNNSINTDLVGDTTPQLGGNLDTNSNDINFDTNDKAQFGNSAQLKIYYDGSNSVVTAGGNGDLSLISTFDDVEVKAADNIFLRPKGGEDGIKVLADSQVELYHNNLKQVETFHASTVGHNPSGSDITGGGVKTTRTSSHNSNIGYYCYKDSNLVARLTNHGSGPEGILQLYNQGDPKLTMNGTNGTIKLHGTASYIQFGDTNSASHQLDDYEEGTWTPVIRGPGGTGTAGSGNAGFFTKVGDVVHAHATVHWTAISGTTSSVVQILGLPFNTKNVSHYRSTSLIGGQVVGVHNGNNAAMNIAIGVDANQSFVYVTGVNGSSTASYNYTHQPTVRSTGQIFGFAITYLTG